MVPPALLKLRLLHTSWLAFFVPLANCPRAVVVLAPVMIGAALRLAAVLQAVRGLSKLWVEMTSPAVRLRLVGAPVLPLLIESNSWPLASAWLTLRVVPAAKLMELAQKEERAEAGRTRLLPLSVRALAGARLLWSVSAELPASKLRAWGWLVLTPAISTSFAAVRPAPLKLKLFATRVLLTAVAEPLPRLRAPVEMSPKLTELGAVVAAVALMLPETLVAPVPVVLIVTRLPLMLSKDTAADSRKSVV